MMIIQVLAALIFIAWFFYDLNLGLKVLDQYDRTERWRVVFRNDKIDKRLDPLLYRYRLVSRWFLAYLVFLLLLSFFGFFEVY